MGVYQRNDRWMVFYHDQQGNRKDKSFGKGDSAYLEAERFDKAIKEARKQGWPVPLEKVIDQLSEPPVPSKKARAKSAPRVQSDSSGGGKGATFEQLCNAYLDELSISGRSENHIENVTTIARNTYYAHMNKDKLAEQFSYLDDIVPFFKAMQGIISPRTKKPRSQTTINRYGDYLGAIFNFGVRVGLITKNPVKGRRKSKEVPRAVQLTVDDIKKIMDHAEKHVKWAIEVCFNLGTRSGESELLSLKWENVDFAKKEVLIYGRKTKEFRKVPITDSFLARLEEMKKVAKTEYVIEYRGKHIRTIGQGFRNACDKAGITYPVRMYDLRHMFATTMLANGADLAAVSKLMGHAKITMTADVYYQYMQGEKERAVSLLPSLATV